MTDQPIDEVKDGRFAGVIDLAGVRIARGFRRRTAEPPCPHHNLTFDQSERRVWCRDCERTIESFDALVMVADHFEKMVSAARSRLETANAAMAATVHRRAAKALDHVWSGKDRAALCPHCRKGLLAEDFGSGVADSTSREYELARRKRGAVSPRGK